jgi:2-polyprenyl-6-methoxyphenol hydroxylase-like FAD-dependent oxidoreductase
MQNLGLGLNDTLEGIMCKQTAVIRTVKVEWDRATAWQRYLPTGPFALLPLGSFI